MRLYSPILQYLPPEYLLSTFIFQILPAIITHIQGILQVELSFQIGEVWTGLVWKSENMPPLLQQEFWNFEWLPESPFIVSFPICQGVLVQIDGFVIDPSQL